MQPYGAFTWSYLQKRNHNSIWNVKVNFAKSDFQRSPFLFKEAQHRMHLKCTEAQKPAAVKDCPVYGVCRYLSRDFLPPFTTPQEHYAHQSSPFFTVSNNR